jgi:hypothetical protein
LFTVTNNVKKGDGKMKILPINRADMRLIQGNHSLSHYLASLHEGRPATPRSWLYETRSADSVLREWIPIMKSGNKPSPLGNIFDQFDLAQVKKFGPQGLVPSVKSKEALETLVPMYSPSEFDSPTALQHLFKDAEAFAREAFGAGLKRHRPKCFERVVDDMRARDTLSTNSGFPRFARRSTVIDQEVQDAYSGNAYDYPAIILFRQYNGKLRPVWMFPMAVNLIEFSYAQVIQDALQKSNAEWIRIYLSPWIGFDRVKSAITDQWSTQNVDGGDTTKMDAHMRPAQIMLVYEIVKWLFQEKYWSELRSSLMNICKIDLLIGQTERIVGTHGLASGSGWTQLTETVLQMFMAWRAHVKGQGIGDDFIWYADMTADELVAYLAEYGLPANPDKQTVSTTHFTFLQRYFHRDFFSREIRTELGAYYPTIRALNSMLNPEKFHKPKDWSSDMFCIRNFMILENCVDNPCFCEFVNFVAHGHRDMIPFAQQSRAALAEIQAAASLVPGLSPTYNQEKRDKPLGDFAGIQLAAKL